MHWPSYVKNKFYQTLTELNARKELVESLKTNDRTRTFLNNLSLEISKAEKIVHKRRGTKLKISTIDSCIVDMTRLLLRGIENEAERRAESIIAKHKREEKDQYYKDLEATMEGNPSGEFEELEVSYGDTEEKSEGQKKE